MNEARRLDPPCCWRGRALFGVFTLLGGLAVPPHVLVPDPGIVPAPEPVAAILIIMAGLLIVLWPAQPGEGTD